MDETSPLWVQLNSMKKTDDIKNLSILHVSKD